MAEEDRVLLLGRGSGDVSRAAAAAGGGGGGGGSARDALAQVLAGYQTLLGRARALEGEVAEGKGPRQEAEGAPLLAAPGAGTTVLECPLVTRYYSAKVGLMLVPPLQHAEAGEEAEAEAEAEAVGRVVPSVNGVFICVEDAVQPDEVPLVLEEVRRCHAMLGERELELQLVCLIVQADAAGDDRESASASASAREQLFEWTLDHMFELVEISTSSLPRTHERMGDHTWLRSFLAEEREREKVGVARVYEAMQSVQWNSMELKRPGQESDLVQRKAEAAKRESEDVPTREGDGQEATTEQTTGTSPADKPTPETAAVPVPETEPQPQPQTQPIADSKGPLPVPPPAAATTTEVTGPPVDPDSLDLGNLLSDLASSTEGDGADEASELQNFERLMTAAHDMRRQAASGSMSDDERRARAAELAMQMWTLMGDDDDDPVDKGGDDEAIAAVAAAATPAAAAASPTDAS